MQVCESFAKWQDGRQNLTLYMQLKLEDMQIVFQCKAHYCYTLFYFAPTSHWSHVLIDMLCYVLMHKNDSSVPISLDFIVNL
mmetsp:Transcript_20383/g.46245  ORF Transcript_20383/g.46245 Transcript_20383/m.46245 type:complete len:82 (+) Transcript_20383:1507-1752(+)